MVLDFGGGSEESSTDDDGGVGVDVGIDMRKLLSSSSQTGGGGPNLSRQLMTHLRLLQADLQYLKVLHTVLVLVAKSIAALFPQLFTTKSYLC